MKNTFVTRINDNDGHLISVRVKFDNKFNIVSTTDLNDNPIVPSAYDIYIILERIIDYVSN